MSLKNREMRLVFPGDWLDERPLSRADLEEDAKHLEGLGYRITVA